ncbi:COG1470 family protein [Endozoicomonas euniceicola]|uniref:DUF11 domain-containing protein n=1 Tax=Endozoicomonas euniceicola TaxID=1234143 RepID=A0ABY6GWN5_9GAMM|nr:hypothetical protein [Endozoicomonas euniceicola]UYM16809.1 hypothetical protein NX720_02465 [Endozoicomonas euniceicola]
MFKGLQKQLFPVWAWALLLMGILGAATVQAATTPAGTQIKNLATVTYQDALGNEKTVHSNESVVTVAEVYSAELKDNQTKDGAPGQLVYFAHQLINKGNTGDEFTLKIVNPDSALDKDSLKIYHDANGNGQPDSGEPEVRDDMKVKVARGETVNLVVAARAPANVANPSYELTLQATAEGDHNSFGGQKTAANTDTIKISNGTILVSSKEVISHDQETGEVKYRVQVINNGADLKNGGAIYDFFPKYLKLAGLNQKETSDSRLENIEITKSNDLIAELPTGAKYIKDNNHDDGMRVRIKELKKGHTVAFEFTVKYEKDKDENGQAGYSFEAGTVLKNKAFVGFGGKDGERWKQHVETNTVTARLPQVAKVVARNKDDSGDTETVKSAAQGEVVQFINTITNLGNGTDTFNLTVKNVPDRAFPEGTIFSLWNEKGTVLLTDTNNDGIIDTGELKSVLAAKNGEGSNVIRIMVKAKLPGKNKRDQDFRAELTATSVVDVTAQGTVTEVLQEIAELEKKIDVANYQFDEADKDVDFKGEKIDVKDFFKSDAKDDYHPGGQITSIINRKSGQIAEFGLFVANKSSVSDSFALTSSGADTTGWKVTFHHQGIVDSDNKQLEPATGQQISTTPLLPKNTVMKVLARVEVPESAKAGDYEIEFDANSTTRSVMGNFTTNQITVKKSPVLIFSPPGVQTIEAGGVAHHQHILENKGNVDLNITINGKKGQGMDSWNYRLLEKSTQTPIDNIVMALKPGSKVEVTVEISAPANAAAGQTFNLELTAEDKTMRVKATLVDSTTVISSQLDAVKQVKVLTGKGKDDAAIIAESKYLTTTDFQTNAAENARPGEDYAVWQIVVTNKGSNDAENVVIKDAAPNFTTYVVGSDYVAKGTGKLASSSTGANIQFNVGKGADETKGGILKPGESVEVRFTVKLD